jgi:hypothetical protein
VTAQFFYEGLYLLEDLQRMNQPSRVKGAVHPAGAAKSVTVSHRCGPLQIRTVFQRYARNLRMVDQEGEGKSSGLKIISFSSTAGTITKYG